MNDPATERDRHCCEQLEALLRHVDAGGPVIRVDVVNAARARLLDGVFPSARDLAITLIEEMT
jgi:hypothetical protein